MVWSIRIYRIYINVIAPLHDDWLSLSWCMLDQCIDEFHPFHLCSWWVTPEKKKNFSIFLEFHLYHMILESGCLRFPCTVFCQKYTLACESLRSFGAIPEFTHSCIIELPISTRILVSISILAKRKVRRRSAFPYFNGWTAAVAPLFTTEYYVRVCMMKAAFPTSLTSVDPPQHIIISFVHLLPVKAPHHITTVDY